MSISFPRTDIMTTVGFIAEGYDFKLNYRQEQSRTATGVTFVKDFGSALWGLKATTQALPHDMALDYEAMLESLDGAVNPFMAYDLRRPYPKAHASGNFSDTAVVASIGGNNKSLTLSGLAAGFMLSRGDYLEIIGGGWSYVFQICEPATASAGGVTPLFEVRPHLFPGAAAGAAVKLKKPSMAMTLTPGSISKAQMGGLHTSVSFAAIQAFKP